MRFYKKTLIPLSLGVENGTFLSTQDMSWDHQYKHVLSKAYKTLGLLRKTFSRQHLPVFSLSHLMWRERDERRERERWEIYLKSKRNFVHQISAHILLYYMETTFNYRHKDDRTTPKRATKFILNNYESDYYDCLLKLNLLLSCTLLN